MAFNQTEKQEKEYLKQIISFLKKVIGNTDASVKDHVSPWQNTKTISGPTKTSTHTRYAPCAKAS